MQTQFAHHSLLVLIAAIQLAACASADTRGGNRTAGNDSVLPEADASTGVDASNPVAATTGPNQYAGVWVGHTSQNNVLRFQVLDSGVIGGFEANFDMDLGSATCTGPLGAVSTPTISGNQLRVTLAYPDGNVTTTMQGAFSDSSSISGTYDGFDQSYLVLCGSTLTMGSGGSVISTGTWQASKCSANDPSADCSTSCTYTNDGYCDEPVVGSGLCFVGTDTNDCSK